MKTKLLFGIIPLLFGLALLSGCQAAPAAAQTVPSTSLPAATIAPNLQATATQPPTASPSATAAAAQPAEQADEAAIAAQAYFTAVAAGESETAARMLSTFSLAVFQITRGDATAALQAQKIAGVRWSDLKLLGVQPFDDQTALVHVTYTESGRAAPAQGATPAQTAAETVEALWPMRLERGEWRYNWNNLIDFRTLDADAQTTSGITILPTQLTRYSDRIEFAMLVQNRTNETVVFGQVNETLGTFYFDDQTVVAEKTQWILNPLRAVPAATLEIKGLFTSLPDKVEIRKWNNYNVEPWYIFQVK